MLPSLAGIDLKAHKVASTDEFYTLNELQKQQLEAAGDVEMFSQETPAVHNGGTFRVAKTRNARPDVMTDYDWYDGQQLWQWAQTHELDPLRKPWWYEDWMALRNRYNPRFAPPGWVNGLQRLFSNAGLQRLLSNAGRAAEARQQSQSVPNAGSAAETRQQSQSRNTNSNSRAATYNSHYGPYNPRPGWPDFGDNVTWVRDVRNGYNRGWHILEEGAKRFEVTDAHSQVSYYEGPVGQERLVRVFDPETGTVAIMEGPPDREYQVRTEFRDGTVWYFEGGYEQEHVVRKEYPNGKVENYEGARNQERMVRVEKCVVEHYTGPKGQERLVRTETRQLL